MAANTPNRMNALVRGAGPAGLTAAKLLHEDGWSVRVVRTGNAPNRSIAIPAHTVRMIEDIWQLKFDTAFAHHMINTRRVWWSSKDRGLKTEAPAMCVDLARWTECLCKLLQCTRPEIEFTEEYSVEDSEQAFVIDARGSPSPATCDFIGGQRQLYLLHDVPAKDNRTACAEIISGAGYWIFLLPTRRDRMSVQIATPEGLLDWATVFGHLSRHLSQGQSLVTDLLDYSEEVLHERSHVATIAPRFAKQTNTIYHLPIGDRALTFDPVCGDGTGQSIKSALLATATLNAHVMGEPTDKLLEHYYSRHLFAFSSHLRLCADYYSTIRFPEHWRGEVARTKEILDVLKRETPAINDRYTLEYRQIHKEIPEAAGFENRQNQTKFYCSLMSERIPEL